VAAPFRQREGRFKRQPAELMPNHFSIPPSEAHEVKTRTQFSRRLLRLKPAAEYLSLSPGKLRALIQACEIPVVKYGENAPWLIDVRDLDYWIERSKTNVG
jgi:excisionase family DNA binding protein